MGPEKAKKKKPSRNPGHYKNQKARRDAVKARYVEKKARKAEEEAAGPLVALRREPAPMNRAVPPWLNAEAGGYGERGDVTPRSFGFGS